MSERIKITLSVDEETNLKIKRIGELTHRADSHVVDLAIEDLWNRLFAPKSAEPEPTKQEAA